MVGDLVPALRDTCQQPLCSTAFPSGIGRMRVRVGLCGQRPKGSLWMYLSHIKSDDRWHTSVAFCQGCEGLWQL